MQPERKPGIGKGRIEALADGIFAVAMTLLILDVKVPALGPEETPAELPRKLLELWPRLLAYAVSFLVLGVLWVGHHALMHHVRRSDRVFLWINLLFLLLVSLLPFSAALLGSYGGQPAAVQVYCANLIAAGLALYAQLRYAAATGQLFDDADPELARAAGRRILMGPVIYSIAGVVAIFSTTASLILCALTIVLYILPGRVDRFWR